MKIAIASDIHSNLPALEEFLQETQDCDQRWNLGDVVGYGPWPSKCVNLVRENFDISIQGNHDRVVSNEGGLQKFNSMARSGAKHSIKVLDKEQKEWLSSLPEKKSIINNNINARIAHSHPIHTDKYVRPDDFEDMTEYLNNKYNYNYLFLGHTHIQDKQDFRQGTIVNPGSVGQPRDGDPNGGYAIYEEGELSLHRFNYDKSEYVNQVRKLGLPRRNAQRLFSGK